MKNNNRKHELCLRHLRVRICEKPKDNERA